MNEDKILTQEEKEALKSWSNVGSAGSRPTVRFTPSKDKKLIPMKNPVKMETEWCFTEDQFAGLQFGHEAHEMEDKWNIYMDDHNILHFHRSWTGYEVFRFTLQFVKENERVIKNAAYKVDCFFYEGDKEIYNVASGSDAEDSLYEVMKFVLRLSPFNVIGE